MNASCDDVLCGKLRIIQPLDGPRVNMDTILLYSWVKFRSGHTRFLEAGCASGAIALMLAAKFANIHVTGIDIQSELIDLARINAHNNSLDDRVDFIAGDFRDKSLLAQGSYDTLVINPPYESLYRSRESNNLSRSTARLELSCTPEDVGRLAKRVLKSRGRLFAVFTSQRLDVFMNSMTQNKLAPKRIRFVYPEISGNSGVFLIECVKDGGEGLSVLPPLIVRDDCGNYTGELMQIYRE